MSSLSKKSKVERRSQAPNFAMFSQYSVCATPYTGRQLGAQRSIRQGLSSFLPQLPVWCGGRLNVNTGYDLTVGEESHFAQEVREGLPRRLKGP